MRPFRDLPLGHKLTLVIMATCCFALVLGGIALTARYAAGEEQKLAERLTVLAKVSATNVAAAVAFNDRLSARETLAALVAEPSVVAAEVRDREGAVFADFVAPQASRPGTPSLSNAAEGLVRRVLGGGRALASSPVVVDGEAIGAVRVEADLRPLRTALVRDVGMFSVIIIAAGLVALLLATRLQAIISEPIVRLARVMKYVSGVKDYSARVERPGQDEIGTLIDGFNEMLAQIRARDDALEHHRRQLEDAQRIARLGNWEWDVAGGRMLLSAQACRVVGLDERAVEASFDAFIARVDPDDRARVRAAFEAAAEGGGTLDVEHRLADRRHAHVRGEATGNGTRLAGSVQDVSERVQAEEELRVAANALESTGDAVVILDPQLRIVSVNKAFTAVTGFASADGLGKPIDFLRSDRHEPVARDEMRQRLESAGQWHGELWGRRRCGTAYPQWVSVSEVRDKAGQVSHYVSVSKDISERKQYEMRLEFLAHHDPLTQLPNRALFDVRLREAVLRAQRHDRVLAVMFIDLDHFKAINDSLGHEAGDTLLKTAAARIKACLRASDTVARQGGDEFTVLLDELQDAGDAGTVAQKLVDALASAFVLDGREAFVGASVGIATYPADGLDSETLMKHADAAMYRAKESGRNAFRFHAGAAAVIEEGEVGLA